MRSKVDKAVDDARMRSPGPQWFDRFNFMQRRKLHSGVHCRQSILPTTKENLWRPNLREYTRRPYAASSPPQETDPSGTFSCNRSRLFRNRLLTMVRSRHVASTLCRSARQPFRWSLRARHHPLAHSRHPTALPDHRPISAPTSVTAFLDFYSGHSPRLQELKHFADQAKHRRPFRPLKPFLRYPCSSSRCSRRYPTLLGGTVAVCVVLPNRHCLHRESLHP